MRLLISHLNLNGTNNECISPVVILSIHIDVRGLRQTFRGRLTAISSGGGVFFVGFMYLYVSEVFLRAYPPRILGVACVAKIITYSNHGHTVRDWLHRLAPPTHVMIVIIKKKKKIFRQFDDFEMSPFPTTRWRMNQVVNLTARWRSPTETSDFVCPIFSFRKYLEAKMSRCSKSFLRVG